MGIGQTRSQTPPSLSAQNWQRLPASYQPPSYGHPNLLRNTLTHQQIEQYPLIFRDRTQYQDYLHSFSWRQREQHLVNTRYLQVTNRDHLYCGAKIQTRVYLERIAIRLSHISDLQAGHGMYLLLAMLQGFEKIFRVIGYFRVCCDMVGFDSEGRVKVWLNSNFSKHYLYGPHYLEPQTNPFEQRHGNEKQIVAEIINMALEKTLKQKQHQSLIQSFMSRRHNGHTFATAKQDLRLYSTRSGHVMPCNLHSPLSKMIRVPQQSQSSSIVIDQSQTSSLEEGLKINFGLVEPKLVHYRDPLWESSRRSSYKQTQTPIKRALAGVDDESRIEPRSRKVSSLYQTFSKKPSQSEVPSRPSILLENQAQGVSNSLLVPPTQPRPGMVRFTYKDSDSYQKRASSIGPSRFRSLSGGYLSQDRLKDSVQVTYSDTREQYVLDQELAIDMVRMRPR